jgi:hypothetical protein
MSDWPRDAQGKRTDPIGRFIERLPLDKQRALAVTCSVEASKVTLDAFCDLRRRLDHMPPEGMV